MKKVSKSTVTSLIAVISMNGDFFSVFTFIVDPLLFYFSINISFYYSAFASNTEMIAAPASLIL